MRVVALCLLPFALTSPALAVDLKTRSVVKDLQYAEQLVAAAAERQDIGKFVGKVRGCWLLLIAFHRRRLMRCGRSVQWQPAISGSSRTTCQTRRRHARL